MARRRKWEQQMCRCIDWEGRWCGDTVWDRRSIGRAWFGSQPGEPRGDRNPRGSGQRPKKSAVKAMTPGSLVARLWCAGPDPLSRLQQESIRAELIYAKKSIA